LVVHFPPRPYLLGWYIIWRIILFVNTHAKQSTIIHVCVYRFLAFHLNARPLPFTLYLPDNYREDTHYFAVIKFLGFSLFPLRALRQTLVFSSLYSVRDSAEFLTFEKYNLYIPSPSPPPHPILSIAIHGKIEFHVRTTQPTVVLHKGLNGWRDYQRRWWYAAAGLQRWFQFN